MNHTVVAIIGIVICIIIVAIVSSVDEKSDDDIIEFDYDNAEDDWGD